MITLAIETASSNLGIALLKGESILAVSELDNGMTHSVNIMSLIQFVLSRAGIEKDDIDLISVDEGPGSFTSLRIGMTTARGLAQFGNHPIVSVNSLRVLRENLRAIHNWNSSPDSYVEKPLLIPMIDARKKRVYASIFSHNETLEENLDIEPLVLIEKIKELNQPVILIGSGANLYHDLWKKELKDNVLFFPNEYNILHGIYTALLGRKKFLATGEIDLNHIIPNYVRKTDAELKLVNTKIN